MASTDGTFPLTSLGAQAGEAASAPSSASASGGGHGLEMLQRARGLHAQLNGVVATLNVKVGEVLAKQEREFLRAYRAHMYTVQRELQSLRAKADDAALQVAKSEKIRSLEAERNWYRGEALRLDQFCSALKADVSFMRDKLQALDEDRSWLDGQLKQALRQSRLLQARLKGATGLATTLDLSLATAAPSALAAPGGGIGGSLGALGALSSGGSVGSIGSERGGVAERGAGAEAPASFGFGAGGATTSVRPGPAASAAAAAAATAAAAAAAGRDDAKLFDNIDALDEVAEAENEDEDEGDQHHQQRRRRNGGSNGVGEAMPPPPGFARGAPRVAGSGSRAVQQLSALGFLPAASSSSSSASSVGVGGVGMLATSASPMAAPHGGRAKLQAPVAAEMFVAMAQRAELLTQAVSELQSRNNKLRARNQQLLSERSESQSLLLACVDETKREVARRRLHEGGAAAAAAALAASGPGLRGAGAGTTSATSTPKRTSSASVSAPESPSAGLGAVTAKTLLARVLPASAAAPLPQAPGVLRPRLRSSDSDAELLRAARARTVSVEDFNAHDKRELVARLLEQPAVLDRLRDAIFTT